MAGSPTSWVLVLCTIGKDVVGELMVVPDRDHGCCSGDGLHPTFCQQPKTVPADILSLRLEIRASRAGVLGNAGCCLVLAYQ